MCCLVATSHVKRAVGRDNLLQTERGLTVAFLQRMLLWAIKLLRRRRLAAR